MEIFIYCKILGECSASFALFSCKGYMGREKLQFFPTAAIFVGDRENIPDYGRARCSAGNKLDPGRFRIADIYDTRVCPLARVMRRELKKRNVKSLKVVYSDEQPIRPVEDMSISCRTKCICPPGAAHKCTERRDIPGSTAFVPAVAGLMIAGEIVKDLSK